MIDKKTLVLALSLFLGSPALAQDPPAAGGQDGLSQRVPWSNTPRGDAAAVGTTTEATRTEAVSTGDEEADLARFVLDFAERRVQKVDEELLAPLAASTARPVIDLRYKVRELQRQLRRAGSTCPEGYAGFVRKILPLLEQAEEHASALSKTQRLLSEAQARFQAQGTIGRALSRESETLSVATRELVQRQLDAALLARAEGGAALQAMDLESVRATLERVDRAFDGARSIIRNARRGNGPAIQ